MALELEVEFAAREELRTEISAKFTKTGIARDLSAAGLEIARYYTDAQELFAVLLVRRVQGAGD